MSRPTFSSETGAQLTGAALTETKLRLREEIVFGQLLQRLQNRQSLSQLDRTLFPEGLEPSVAVEVFGEAGVGKTEVLLHLIVNSILPSSWQGRSIGGLGVGAIYMDTDHHFTLVRLIRILEARLQTAARPELAALTDDQTQEFVTSCLKRLYLVHCTDSDQMIVTLHAVEQLVTRKREVSLLVVDSVSAFYWQDRLIHGSFTQVDAHYRHLANILRKLMNECKLTVLFSRQHLINYKQSWVDQHRGASESIGPFDPEERYFLGNSMQRIPSWRINLIRVKGDPSEVVVAHVRGRHRSSTLRFCITSGGIQFSTSQDT